MTEQDIANALREHLAGTPMRPDRIAWENQSPGVNPPFWAVSQVKTPPERLGTSKIHRARGRLVVAVLTVEHAGLTIAETQAEAIIARFPTDLRLPAGDGAVQIIARPYADDGYNDGAYWRVNVHVRWLAFVV